MLASGWVRSQYSCCEAAIRDELIEYAAKQVVHDCRCGVTVKERMSGRPHDWADDAPPASNDETDPTAAKESLHAWT